jgi:hypothetical protein
MMTEFETKLIRILENISKDIKEIKNALKENVSPNDRLKIVKLKDYRND